MSETFERLNRELVFRAALFDYYQDTLKLPNGNVVKWDFISHKGAAGVLPVLPDGRIMLVRQFRPCLDRETLEIPCGGINPGEPTDVAAQRELEEETGYVCGNCELLLSVRTTVAFCNEKIDIYLVRELTETAQHLDEDEFIGVECYTLDELTQMVCDGVIQDGKTVSAIMTYAQKYGKESR